MIKKPSLKYPRLVEALHINMILVGLLDGDGYLITGNMVVAKGKMYQCSR